jgi:hypothetical protein
MEAFVAQIVGYIGDNELWAHQGGPIIMSQIENELGSGDDRHDESDDTSGIDDGYLYIDARGQFVNPLEDSVIGPIRKATLQDYADWCGDIAKKYEPNVTWTMCNGLSANNTIHTCNAINEGAGWLESYGANGRIQVDQPPICEFLVLPMIYIIVFGWMFPPFLTYCIKPFPNHWILEKSDRI